MKISVLSVSCLLVFSLFSSAVEAAVDNCEDLNINTDIQTPMKGDSLKYCKTSEFQCCNDAYFAKRGLAIRKLIRDDIKYEISKQVDRLSDIVDGVQEELTKRFIPRFSRNFCGPVEESTCDPIVGIPSNNFIKNLLVNGDDDDFSVGDLISEYVNATVSAIITGYVQPKVSDLTVADRLCIMSNLQTRPAQHADLYGNITQIRFAISALVRLRNHVRSSVLSKIFEIQPTNSCVKAFIVTRCPACSRNITDFCRGACNALVFACLSPFAEGLTEQFNLLWNSTGQMINITNRLLEPLGSIPQTLFTVNHNDADALAQLFSTKCDISLSSRKRDAGGDQNGGDNDDEYKLPKDVTKNSTDLLNSGAFSSSDVPTICSNYTNTDCWNGTHTVPMNNVNFNSMSVDGQKSNPLFADEFDAEEMDAISDSLDTVITSYLKSKSFQDVIPEGLSLTNITDDGDSESGATSASAAGYCALVLFALLIVLFAFN